ncbi:MAG: amidase family protein, partial [Patescibacteria group bacterium]
SIRQPASFCGVVGLKPTYGRVSRYGLMAMTSSLDQIGPFTKTVRDAAFLFNAIAGLDPNDATTVDQPPLTVANLERDIRGMTIGVPDEYFIEGMDPDVQAAVEAALKQYEAFGVKVVRLSLPLTKYALGVYYLTVTSEISANLSRYDGIRYGLSASGAKNLAGVYAQSRAAGFGSEVKRRAILGTFTLSAGYYDRYYVKAQQVRELIRREFAQAFKQVDCLVTPTSPSVAFKLAEKFEDPLLMYLSDIYTVPANIGGVCAVSVPCGFSRGLPIGLQVISRPFGEELALRLAYHYEQATEWHTQKPPIR